jgi:hypothetical protein
MVPRGGSPNHTADVGLMNMKPLIRGMYGLTACVLALAAGGCANTGIRHVDADEFVRQAKSMEYANSASGAFYIGASPTRVYVERTGLYRLIRLHDAMVYWTELDGLPKDVADTIRSGRCPWKPWQDEMQKANKAVKVQNPAAGF